MCSFVCLFGAFDTHTRTKREREKSPFSSPLLPSGRTNEREKELKWAKNNNNDSSETRENEREIEKKKKKIRARARETKKKGLSAADAKKERGDPFFLSKTRKTTFGNGKERTERKETFHTMTFGTDEYCRAIEFSAAREPLLKMECATIFR